MDLVMPPMPFSTVFVPEAARVHLQIPEEMRTPETPASNQQVGLPAGVAQVIVSWRGTDALQVRHYHSGGYDTIASIPAVSSARDRSTGVLTLASDTAHSVSVIRTAGGNWDADTLSKGYDAGVQVMPMGTAADVTGGGSMLRVDNSVGTRVLLGDQMLFGDTGWRGMEAFIPSTWETGYFRMRRRGDIVSVWVFAMHRKADTFNVFNTTNTLPHGFRPNGRTAGVVTVRSNPVGHYGVTVDGTSMWVGQSLDGSNSTGISLGSDMTFTFNYTTTDDWPTVLPGTPA